MAGGAWRRGHPRLVAALGFKNPNHEPCWGATAADRERFYSVGRLPQETNEGDSNSPAGTRTSRTAVFAPATAPTWRNGNLVFRRHAASGHGASTGCARQPATGHLTGETRKGGDACNALFEPECPRHGDVSSPSSATPQDALESANLNYLARKRSRRRWRPAGSAGRGSRHVADRQFRHKPIAARWPC